MATKVHPTAVAPDIGYAPDLDKYLARVKCRTAQENLAQELPEGFPKELKSDLVWTAEDIGDDWAYELQPSEIQEIEDALQHFLSLDKPLGYIDQETFPLPKLHAALRNISHEIHHGRGLKVVRGLPFHHHDRRENIIIYAGVASHVGPLRARQDFQADGKPADVVLNHIKDLTKVVDPSLIGAPAYTTDKQVFHTDAGDIIALACLETAAEGGESKLSSAWNVYNELARTRPDLIRTLSEPWPTENFGSAAEKYTLRPILTHHPATADHPERVVMQYARRTFTGYWGLPRSPDIPALTEAQAEALDALHFLAEKYAVSLGFRKGDVQFANNLSIFHARDGFRDTPEQQRHLVRLWLRDPENAWPTPEPQKPRWERLYVGVKPENQVFPLESRIRTSSAGTTNGKIE